MLEGWRGLSENTQDELAEMLGPQLFNKKSEDLADEERSRLEFLSNPNLYRAMCWEFNTLVEGGRETQDPGQSMAIPLKVLVRDSELAVNNLVNSRIPKTEAQELEDLIQLLMRKQAQLSSKGEIIEAKGCAHNIYCDDPELVLSAIQDVVKEIMSQ